MSGNLYISAMNAKSDDVNSGVRDLHGAAHNVGTAVNHELFTGSGDLDGRAG